MAKHDEFAVQYEVEVLGGVVTHPDERVVFDEGEYTLFEGEEAVGYFTVQDGKPSTACELDDDFEVQGLERDGDGFVAIIFASMPPTWYEECQESVEYAKVVKAILEKKPCSCGKVHTHQEIGRSLDELHSEWGNIVGGLKLAQTGLRSLVTEGSTYCEGCGVIHTLEYFGFRSVTEAENLLARVTELLAPALPAPSS